ncbi:hypothetical protein D922_02593 [Enterococcus faecalis 06-MB-DW-09]|nr:hypothetical protein D922_02593 [Enterococcus faecalis 06-MB-DW-09]
MRKHLTNAVSQMPLHKCFYSFINRNSCSSHLYTIEKMFQ